MIWSPSKSGELKFGTKLQAINKVYTRIFS